MTVPGASQANGTLDGPGRGMASALGPRKRRILDLIEAYPGLNLDEVAVAIGVRRTAAKHHLRGLERMGHVLQVRWGRHTLHFSRAITPAERLLFCLFRVPSVHQVALSLLAQSRLDRPRLASDLGVTPRTIRRALRLLTRHDLVRIERSGGAETASLHPHLRVLLARERLPAVLDGEDTP